MRPMFSSWTNLLLVMTLFLGVSGSAMAANNVLAWYNTPEQNKLEALEIIHRGKFSCDEVISIDQTSFMPAAICSNGKLYRIDKTKKGGKVVSVENAPPLPVAPVTLPSWPISDALREVALKTAELSIRDHLNDPHSYERTGGSIGSTDDHGAKTLTLDVKYLAKNGYGGVGRHEAILKLDETGAIVLLFLPLGD